MFPMANIELSARTIKILTLQVCEALSSFCVDKPYFHPMQGISSVNRHNFHPMQGLRSVDTPQYLPRVKISSPFVFGGIV